MLSDRITLAVAHYYMSGTEANYRFDYGKIDEIKLSYTSNFKSSATLLQFNDLFSLAEFIEKSTKPTKNQAQEEAECTNMGLYELKSFRIGSIFVNQNANGIFVSSSENIANIDLTIYKEYKNFFKQVEEVYYHVYSDDFKEYILSQNNYPPTVDIRKYINCGYIQTLFGPYVDKLKALFDTYKSNHKNN
jgi:predicted hydrocarbon binding protein